MSSPRKRRAFAVLKGGHLPVRMVWLTGPERDEEGADGFYAPYGHVIGVFGGLSPSRGAEIFLHEISHAVMEQQCIDCENWPKDEETFVVNFSKGLAVSMAANRRLFERVLGLFHSREKTVRRAWERAGKRRR